MLQGTELGLAIKAAIEKKGISQRALAKAMGVKPPSVTEWCQKGTISKGKLENLWRFFEDVVGPDHWGLEVSYPTVNEQASGYQLSDLAIARRAVRAIANHLLEHGIERRKTLSRTLERLTESPESEQVIEEVAQLLVKQNNEPSSKQELARLAPVQSIC
jgi:transcriptional regulator with XRE-family HTH domain